MENEVLVKAENVKKKFCRDLKTSLWYGVKDLGAELTGGRKTEGLKLRKKEFWAVNDISFELRRGECMGLIGRNGAGKSTLLKILNGLIKPDGGRIEMRGRIGALIELGAGFNPILTGRENIYNNGSVLGLPRKEIDGVLDEIIEFSEMEKFIDTPVQYYSSGMKVRLGFSVAVHMKPDVLILDEVLAVGDSGFKIKSFNKINEIMRNAAVIFVSHSMPHIATITNKVLLMEGGEVDYFGANITEGIDRYYNEFQGYEPEAEFEELCAVKEMIVQPSPGYEDISKPDMPVIDYGADLKVKVKLSVDNSFSNFHYRLLISDKDLKYVGLYDSFQDGRSMVNRGQEMETLITVPNFIFIDGEYAITLFIQSSNDQQEQAEILGVYRYWKKFKVRASKGLGYTPTVVYLPGKVETI